MCNKLRDIDIKNCTYYFLNDMINIKNLNIGLLHHKQVCLMWLHFERYFSHHWILL